MQISRSKTTATLIALFLMLTIAVPLAALPTANAQSTSATYAFIGPMLPLDPGEVVKKLEGLVDEVLIDQMNYSNKVKALYRKHKLEQYLEDDYFRLFGNDLKTRFEKLGIPVTMIF